MSFINWGNETPEQKALRAKFEQDDLYEQAVRARSGQSPIGAPGVGGGSLPQTPHVDGVDFTIEWFMKINSWGSHPRPYSLGEYPAPNAVSIEGGGGHIYWWVNGAYPVDSAVSTISTGAWHHYAVTRNNGVLKIFLDGVQQGEDGTFNDNIIAGSNELWIGAEPGPDSYVNGYITNFRWTASAVYTGNFSVPTSPLTALAQTKFLLKATNNGALLTDSSTFARTVTNYGTATWSADSPFAGGVGGSISLNGSSQYLTVPASTDWNL